MWESNRFIQLPRCEWKRKPILFFVEEERAKEKVERVLSLLAEGREEARKKHLEDVTIINQHARQSGRKK